MEQDVRIHRTLIENNIFTVPVHRPIVRQSTSESTNRQLSQISTLNDVTLENPRPCILRDKNEYSEKLTNIDRLELPILDDLIHNYGQECPKIPNRIRRQKLENCSSNKNQLSSSDGQLYSVKKGGLKLRFLL